MSDKLTYEWLEKNGFSKPTASSVDGYSYHFKYVGGYHAIEVRFEPRNSLWQWRLAEHLDRYNWDDRACSLPPQCQPQTEGSAEYVIAALEGLWNDL